MTEEVDRQTPPPFACANGPPPLNRGRNSSRFALTRACGAETAGVSSRISDFCHGIFGFVLKFEVLSGLWGFCHVVTGFSIYL